MHLYPQSLAYIQPHTLKYTQNLQSSHTDNSQGTRDMQTHVHLCKPYKPLSICKHRSRRADRLRHLPNVTYRDTKTHAQVHMLIYTDPGHVDTHRPQRYIDVGFHLRSQRQEDVHLRVEASRSCRHPLRCAQLAQRSQPCSETHTGLELQSVRHLRATKTASCSQMPVNVWADVSPLPAGRTWGPRRRWEKGKAPHLESSLASNRGRV